MIKSLISRIETNFDSLFIAVSLAAVFVAVLNFTVNPLVFSNVDMRDLLFLANLGWRILNGAEPVLDFNHFYGGITAQYVAWAMQLFGVKAKAIEFAVLLQFATIIPFLCLVSYKRIGKVTFFACLLIVTACILTRTPFELDRPFDYTSHNFIYNRLALVISLVLIVHALFHVQERRLSIITAIVSGCFVFILALIKPTFIVMIPFVVAVFALQRRYEECVFLCVGVVASVIVLDPGLVKLFGAFEFAVHSTSGSASVLLLLKKAIYILEKQVFLVALAFGILGWIYFSSEERKWQFPAAVTLLFGGSVGMATTMGETYMVNRQIVPVSILIILLCYEFTRKHKIDSKGLIKNVALILVVTLSLRGIAYTTIATMIGLGKDNFVPIENGAFSDFLAVSTNANFLREVNKMPEKLLSKEERVAITADFLSQGHDIDVGMEHTVVGEAVEFLSKIEGVQQYGIVSSTRAGFEFIMQAKPVLEYPVWASVSTLKLAEENYLQNVDLILIYKFSNIQNDWLTMANLLRSGMNDNFSVCHDTIFWEIYARQSSDVQGCSVH